VDVQEVRKLDAYLKRVFGNQKASRGAAAEEDDSAEVYIGEEFIGVLFVDDEDDDRSFQFQMAILEKIWSIRAEALDQTSRCHPARAVAPSSGPSHRPRRAIAQASCAENETSGRRRRRGARSGTFQESKRHACSAR